MASFPIIALICEKIQFNSLLKNEVMPHQSCKIGCVYIRPLFANLVTCIAVNLHVYGVQLVICMHIVAVVHVLTTYVCTYTLLKCLCYDDISKCYGDIFDLIDQNGQKFTATFNSE